MNKKTSLYLYILIALFTIFVGIAIFVCNNKEKISEEIGKTHTFTSTSITNFELNLTSANMQQSESGNYVSSSLGTIDVSLISPEGKNTSCTFDLLFSWTSTQKYTTPSVTLPYISGGTTYNYQFSTLVKDGESIAFAERDLSKANAGSGFSGNSGTIAEGLSIEANSKTVSKTYNIEARIYILPVIQNNIEVKNMGVSVIVDNVNCEYQDPIGEGTIYAMMKNLSSNDTGINFGRSPTESTSGVYLRNSTTSNTYPVYYYRGIVDNNNVIFDNFCWKIVRTTENAGIKMIYNGVPSADGSCNNTGEASQLASTSVFNSKSSSPADVGYMYGDRYEYIEKDMSSQSETYIYGNDVSYSNGVYTLINTYSSTNWYSDYITLAKNGYHYTCFGSDKTCEDSVYYVFGDSLYAYYLTLNGEANIEEVKENMFRNENDSIIKTVIDDWYEANIKDKEDKLDDAIWCNARIITRGPFSGNGSGEIIDNYFVADDRNWDASWPSFGCNKKDAFTQNESAVGNGALDNPVGLLTADEYTLAGSGIFFHGSSYLKTGQNQWSLSPSRFSYYYTCGFYLDNYGSLGYDYMSDEYGVRPSISLKPGTKVPSVGDGSAANPYVVE